MTVTNASKDCMSLGHIVNQHVAFLVQHCCDLRGSKVAHPGRVKLQASAASMLRLGVFRTPNFPRRDVEITELKVSFQNQRLEVIANWTNEAV